MAVDRIDQGLNELSDAGRQCRYWLSWNPDEKDGLLDQFSDTSPPTAEAILEVSPLRRSMIDDTSLRNLSSSFIPGRLYKLQRKGDNRRLALEDRAKLNAFDSISNIISTTTTVKLFSELCGQSKPSTHSLASWDK